MVMVKVVAVITRKAGLDREQFLTRWQHEHPAYVRRLPGLRRYVQNPAVEGYRDWAFDGAAELWFDSVREVAAAFASSAGDELRRHEEEFIGDLTWFLADEREISLEAVEQP
jgi:uncharacterized protein (TIGR02118 family)